MAIFARFWNFPKRENSTQIPTDSDIGFGFTINIVGESSVISPTITLRQNHPYNTNYCYIPEFERYYFVRDWSFTAQTGLWTASLECDVLASFRDEIGKSSQYILRSASAYNGNILDTTYPTKTDFQQNVNYITNLGWVNTIDNGTYIVGIVNSDNDSIGAVSYYTMRQAEFNVLMEYLMDNDTNWLDIPSSEISEELTKALFNPFQYIVSCIWIPVDPSIVQGDLMIGLKFGWWTTNISAHRLKNNAITTTNFTIDIPKHPDSKARGNYLNLSPFSRYSIFVPPFGSIPLDSTEIINFSNISGSIMIDLITGIGSLSLSGTDNEGAPGQYIFRSLSTQVGVQIQLAQITRDNLGLAATVIGAAGDIASEALSLDFGGAISATANGIYSSVKAAMPQMLSGGTNGSMLFASQQPRLQAQFFLPVEETLSHRGRPLCEERVINTLPGFILCSDVDMAISGTAEECRKIKDYMDNGFFWE